LKLRNMSKHRRLDTDEHGFSRTGNSNPWRYGCQVVKNASISSGKSLL
jgi:hypothetical protein